PCVSTARLFPCVKRVDEAYCFTRLRVIGVASLTDPPPILVDLGVGVMVVPVAPLSPTGVNSRIRCSMTSRMNRCGTLLTKLTASALDDVVPGTPNDLVLPVVTVGTDICHVNGSPLF